jgi:hypothetical protein
MSRLLACVTLLATAACSGAVQPGVKGIALVVPSGGASKPRGAAVADVTAALDARALLTLTFNAAALHREAQAGPANDDSATASSKHATVAPAAELPLPKARCAECTRFAWRCTG